MPRHGSSQPPATSVNRLEAMEFAKWEALGNDYVLFDGARTAFYPSAGNVGLVCDRHRGIGSDGVVLIGEPPPGDAVASVRIFNPDGSEAEISGNGVRQAILYLHQEGWAPGPAFTVSTLAGPVAAEVMSEHEARVGMGSASTASTQYAGGEPDGRGTLAAGGELWAFRHVSIGNPQCAIRIDDVDALEALDISIPGADIETADVFPQRTNVSWWTELEPARIRTRLYERGVGETSASGTGACGAAVDYVLRGGPGPVTVVMDGGELEVAVGEDLDIKLTGSAREVFSGSLSPELAARLAG